MDANPIWALAWKGGTYLAGVLTGLLKSPMERWISRRGERKRLRYSLYQEYGYNNDKLFWQVVQNSNGIPRADIMPISVWLRREAYDEALRNPSLFREIPEHRFFDNFYLHLIGLRDANPDKQLAGLRQINNTAESLLKRVANYPDAFCIKLNRFQARVSSAIRL